jgi:hypothetical protein
MLFIVLAFIILNQIIFFHSLVNEKKQKSSQNRPLPPDAELTKAIEKI